MNTRHFVALVFVTLLLAACSRLFVDHFHDPKPAPTPRPTSTPPSPTPLSMPTPQPTSVPISKEQALAEYVNIVQRRIRSNMHYHYKGQGNPQAAFQVSLRADMHILHVKLITSSGDRAFDRAAQHAIEKAASYPPLPAELDFADFQTHTIHYRLHDSS